MADYKVPIIVSAGLTIGDLLRWNGNDWVNYPDSNYAGGFVNRGDPAGHDLVEDAFDTDFSSVGDIVNTWYEFDLNAIAGVPINAKAILFRIAIKDNLVDARVYVRDSGNSNGVNISAIQTIVANVLVATDKITPITDGKVDIKSMTAKFSDLTAIYMTVKGWWL